MKKTLFAAFVAFWASVATIAALHGLPQAAAPPAVSETAPAASELPRYSLAEIAEHATLESCWMAIEGRVYDFSDYIPQHPAPPRIMQAWCGREATEGMRSKGIGRAHSPAAWAMIQRYLIGELATD